MIKLFLLLFVSISVNSQNGIEAVGSSAGNHTKTVMLGGIQFKEPECIPNEQFAELTGVKVEESQEVGKIPDGCITVPEVLQLLEVLTEDEDLIQEEDDSVQEGVSVQDGQGDGMGRLLRRHLGKCSDKPWRCHSYTCSMVQRHNWCRYDYWFKSLCGSGPNEACCTCGGGHKYSIPAYWRYIGAGRCRTALNKQPLASIYTGYSNSQQCKNRCEKHSTCLGILYLGRYGHCWLYGGAFGGRVNLFQGPSKDEITKIAGPETRNLAECWAWIN